METKNMNDANNGAGKKKTEVNPLQAAVGGAATGAAFGAGSALATTSYFNSSDKPTDNPEVVAEPVEVTELANATDPVEPIAPIVPEMQTSVDPVDVPISDPTISHPIVTPLEPELVVTEPTDIPSSEDLVQNDDIDSIIDEILAIEEIDPNDIDMADVLSFDSIGIYYTSDGSEYAAASFHDDMGNDLFLVDIDGDLAYDFIVDGEEYIIAEVGGLITQADVELELQDENEFLYADATTIEQIENLDLSNDMVG